MGDHRRPRLTSPALLAVLLVACSDAAPVGVDTPDAAAPFDASTTSADSPPAAVDAPAASVDAPAASVDAPPCTAPPAPYCAREGCTFAPIAIPTCAPGDGGAPEHTVYNEGFCASRVTLLVFVAGWCSVCQAEAARVESDIVQPYGPRGVRVVNVVAQLTNGMAATASFCEVWRSRYRLTSQMTHDPDGRTRPYWPTGVFPVWILLDRRGAIRYRTQHGDGGLTGLRARIDALLAEP